MEIIARLSTHDVKQLLFGIPENHRHCRLMIKTNQDQVLVCSEALVAAIVRAYIWVKTHPERLAVEMNQKILEQHKDDFAMYQLLETDKEDFQIQKELSAYTD